MRAQMFNYHGWCKECDPDALKEHFSAVLISCGFKICGEQHKFFEPQGYTGIFLLSESHFAIHTFPEEEKTYIELSSCVERQYRNFVAAQVLETGDFKVC